MGGERCFITHPGKERYKEVLTHRERNTAVVHVPFRSSDAQHVHLRQLSMYLCSLCLSCCHAVWLPSLVRVLSVVMFNHSTAYRVCRNIYTEWPSTLSIYLFIPGSIAQGEEGRDIKTIGLFYLVFVVPPARTLGDRVNFVDSFNGQLGVFHNSHVSDFYTQTLSNPIREITICL